MITVRLICELSSGVETRCNTPVGGVPRSVTHGMSTSNPRDPVCLLLRCKITKAGNPRGSLANTSAPVVTIASSRGV